jgi:hypothetical protein
MSAGICCNCGGPLPPQTSGRKRQFCGDDCAGEWSNLINYHEITERQKFNAHIDRLGYELIHDPDGTLKPGERFGTYGLTGKTILMDHGKFLPALGCWLPGTVFQIPDGRRLVVGDGGRIEVTQAVGVTG